MNPTPYTASQTEIAVPVEEERYRYRVIDNFNVGELVTRRRYWQLTISMRLIAPFLLSSSIFATTASATFSSRRSPTSPQHVNLWMLETRAKEVEASRLAKTSPLVLQDSPASFANIPPQQPEFLEFPERFFEQPIDHTDPSLGTFKQRYWVNTRHYVPGSGGPVIILDSGETSGVDRLPYLDTGIVEILANATGGVGVVLEHRYYGTVQRQLAKLARGRLTNNRDIHPCTRLQHG